MTDDFRFKFGERFTLELAKSQVDALEDARVDGELPFPTRLKLTSAQSGQLAKLTNKRVLELKVFEGKYRCCACCAQNIASRFAPDKLEVSGDFLADLANLNRKIYDWDTGEPRAADQPHPKGAGEGRSDPGPGPSPGPQ